MRGAQSRKGPLCIAAASLCWSLGGLCIKFIPWGAMSIIGLRALLAAAVFAMYRRSVKINFTRGNILAALCLSATTILVVFANKLTTAAAAILLQFTSPAFIILLQFILYRARPKRSEVIAVSVDVGRRNLPGGTPRHIALQYNFLNNFQIKQFKTRLQRVIFIREKGIYRIRTDQ